MQTPPNGDPDREGAAIASESPPFALWLTLCRISVIVALSASAALYLQYLNPAAAAFCGLESGCEAVRRAGFSYFFDSPLLSFPLVGLVSYGTVLAVSLARPESRALLVLTSVGALSALALLLAQAFVVHAFCWLCVAVDGSAILAPGFAFLDWRARRVSASTRLEPLRRATWLALAAVAVTAPAVWVKVKPSPPVPAVVRALYEPGKINVVEFADFECPYCRKFQPVLKQALRDYPAARLHFVRRHVPLPSHEQALPAARAVVCAEAQGLGEKLADRLVEIEPSPSANRRAALELGADPARFDECLAGSAPDVRINADSRLLEEAGMQGLPTTYIGGKRLLGAVSDAAVRDALDRAFRGESETGVPAPIFVGIASVVLFLVTWLGRKPRGKLLHERTS